MILPELVTNVAPEAADFTGRVLGVLGALLGILAAAFTIFRTSGKQMTQRVEQVQAARPSFPPEALQTDSGHAAIWRRIDELDKGLNEHRLEVAKEYATKAEMLAIETTLNHIDDRSRKTENILRIVFREQLRKANYDFDQDV
jgi:hypothetical protein